MRQLEPDLASTLAKARKIYALLHPVVFIAQSASGAVACDAAICVGAHLCAAIAAMRDLADSPCQFPATPQSRSAAADARHVLRDRAGEPPLPPAHGRGSRMHPLSWREHTLFSNDLKVVQRGLAELAAACWQLPDARRHIRNAIRSLDRLQARFEAAARRDYPHGQDGRSVATLYTGDPQIPRWCAADAVPA